MSKTRINGTIEKAYKNDKGINSILVDGVWYGTYKTSYAELEGSYVTFEAEQKGKYWNAGEVKRAENQAPPPAAGRPAPSSDGRQQSIVLQSSYKTAADVLGHVLAAGAVTLPKTKAEQYDALLGFLDDIARRLYGNCIDPTSFLEGDAPGPVAGSTGEYNPLES